MLRLARFVVSALICASVIVCGHAQVDPPGRNTLFKELNPNRIQLQDAYVCKRLFTTSGVRGCGSAQLSEPNIGPLYQMSTTLELTNFENVEALKGVAVVLEPSLFTRDTIDRLVATGRVSSVLVKTDTQVPANFSPATQDALNPFGDGLADILIPFPVALLGNASTEVIDAKVKENLARDYFQATWQHGIEFSFYQGRTSADTEFCLAQSRCSPVGGYSVWGSIGRVPDAKSSVLLATHLDSSAMFTDLAFGAEGTASGVIALLGAVHAIGQVRSQIPALGKQILFSFFEGEEWDRVGSRRFVFDLSNGCLSAGNNSCVNPPIYNLAWTDLDLGTIDEVIAVDQVGKYYSSEKETYFLHSSSSNTIIDAMNGSSVGINVSSVEGGSLPPSPLDSFLEAAGFQGVGAVLSGYESSFTNPFYRSRFDRRSSGDASAAAEIAKVSTILAQTALRLAGAGSLSDTVVANETVIAELENCLTRDFSCSLVQEFLGVSASQLNNLIFARNVPNAPRIEDPLLPPSYPGFYQRNAFLGPNINDLVPMGTHFVRNFAAFFTEPMLLSEEELDTVDANTSCVSNLICSLKQDFVPCADTRTSSLACVKGRCICTSTHFQDAYTPSINATGGVFRIVNNSDNIFAEVPFSVEIPELALYQSTQQDTTSILFAFGVVVTLGALVFVVYCVPRLDDTALKLTEKKMN